MADYMADYEYEQAYQRIVAVAFQSVLHEMIVIGETKGLGAPPLPLQALALERIRDAIRKFDRAMLMRVASFPDHVLRRELDGSVRMVMSGIAMRLGDARTGGKPN